MRSYRKLRRLIEQHGHGAAAGRTLSFLRRNLEPRYVKDSIRYRLAGEPRLDHDLEGGTVLDAGGYRGGFTEALLERCSPSRIHIFEPVDSYFSELEERFKDRGEVELHGYGLGDTNRTDSVEVSGRGSSIHREHRVDPEEVRIRDVAEVVKELETPIELMDINVEGAEYEILERLLETGLIEDIKKLQIQFHRLVEDAGERRRRIREELRETHEQDFSYRFISELWRLKR